MMKQDQDCRQVRLLWMEFFDGEHPEAPLPVGVARHVEHCAACREFTHGAETTRTGVTAIALPPPSPAADRALLAALALSRPESPAARWQDRLASLVAGFRGPGLRPVCIAGVASFLITLAAGAALTTAPVSSSVATSPQPEPVPTRRAERELETRLQDWLSQPATRPRPPLSLPPAHPRATPSRPRERSDRGTHFHAA